MYSQHRLSIRACVLLVALSLGLPGSRAASSAGALRIDHAPINTALTGQSITVRARVADPAPKSVTLFFATSRDAAPFKVAMSSSGPQIYAGSISETQLTNLKEIYYYIEARDAADNAVETPWYTVKLQPGSPEGGAAVSASKSGTDGKPQKEQAAWVKPTLIGGGLLAAGGIAYAASSGGGGGGDSGDGGGGTSEYAGTYTGTDTTCTQAPTGGTTCNPSGLTITITDQGVVQTSDLRDGQRLETPLSGANFVLVADVNEDGFTGEIQYVGTVVDRRVVGTIQGSATSAAGVAVFSGTFSAVR
ncbi:MAG: hypothetical protein K8T26_01930 [Lentisphaerae bacterium]|nr:hypothetical protein [Lentisphaerota bacterium]